MRICIAAPIATADVAPLLPGGGQGLPEGYAGAPLTGVLIAELIAMGHEVVGITVDYRGGPGPRQGRAHGPNFEFQVLPGRRHGWRFNGRQLGCVLDLYRLERRALAAAILEARCDIVHAHWTYEFALAALETGLPHVITSHDSPVQVLLNSRSPLRAVRLLMARQALGRARCVTAVSNYLAEAVQPMARCPVTVIPNPVARYAIEMGAARAEPLHPTIRRVAMVSNAWGALKNPQPALEAFAQLRQRHTEAELHLFGADFGPDGKAQRWASAHTGGAGLYFHGPVPHRELINQLASMDLLVNPSLEESFGVAIAEAMALGLPVIGGHRSGAVPWVAGPDQWLVDPRSVAALAAPMEEALYDTAAYARASHAGWLRSRGHFAARSVAERYVETYRAALALACQAKGQPGTARIAGA